MSLSKSVGAALLCALTVLSGCSVATMRGKPAETAAECRSDWLLERQSNTTNTTHEAKDFQELMIRLLYTFSGFTTAPDVADTRYRSCLARLGVTDVDGFVAQNVALGQDAGPRLQPLPPRKPAHCPAYASVLYGGAGYCVGR